MNAHLPGAPGTPDMQSLLQMIVATYEHLSPDLLADLETLYAPDVYFEDPAHAIQGHQNLMRYFRTLFSNVEQCQFRFHETSLIGEDLFLTWTMQVRHRRLRSGQTIRVEGASYLKTRHGRIYHHRDYFDLGAMVYENVPVLGAIVRALKHRLGA